MATEKKLSYSPAFHFSCHEKNIRCPADAILNGMSEEIPETKNSGKPQSYSSLIEYCNAVADELPERQAFYLVDLADVLWKVQEWKKCLPKVELFYAVKANTDPVLLQLLTKLGLSFDCASGGEIQMALDAGASPNNIILAHTIKTTEEMKFASEKKVEVMTFDNEDELLKIKRVYPNAKLLVRITPTKVSCSYDLSDKFGCSEDEAIKLLKLAFELNLNVIGVSFHVGSLCDDPESYTSTIQTSRHLFDVARSVGFDFSILDIGGGFYGSTGTESSFYKMADGINKALEEHFNDGRVRIIAEPGTYISCSAFSLVCSVLGRRCFDNAAEEQPKRHYYLNDGLYGSFFCNHNLYFIQPKPALPEAEIQSRPKYQSRIFGQTCCSEDVILKGVVLPDLKIGERIVWSNMGAYARGVSSTFCGVPLTIPKHIFKRDSRLNLDWVVPRKNVENFLKKHAVFIGCTEDDI